MDSNTATLMERGVKCLISELGEVEADLFLFEIKKGGFDYTVWQQNLFNGIPLADLNHKAAEFSKNQDLKFAKAEVV